MASNHKKSNGGRKTGATNSRTAPRHQSVSAGKRSTNSTQSATAAGSRSSGSHSTVERKPTEFTRQQIAEAAYFLWQKHGGSEVGNWLEAERLLKAGLPVR